jgi:hypothetical protein
MPTEPRTPLPLSQSLIGTWELLSREDRTASGERRVDPVLGADPVALLVYDRTGHFAAQFMRRDRSQPAAAPEPQVSAPNNTGARDGYDAYFGLYSVDDATGAVTQRLLGSLSPQNVGMVLTRTLTVTPGATALQDELSITLQTATASGEPITRTLRWRRVG